MMIVFSRHELVNKWPLADYIDKVHVLEETSTHACTVDRAVTYTYGFSIYDAGLLYVLNGCNTSTTPGPDKLPFSLFKHLSNYLS